MGSDELKSSRAVERMRARLGKSGMVEFNLDERDMTKDPQVERYRRLPQHLSHGG